MTNLSPLLNTKPLGIPGIAAWFFLLAFAFAAAPALGQTSCCQIARNKGQAAFDKKDYPTAINHWKAGKGCPDAAKTCPDLDALIKKAQAAAQPKPVTPTPKPQPKPQPQGPTEAERQAQEADKAAKAAFDLAKDINTIPAYDSFLKNHGSSSYAAEARSRKKALEDAPKPQQPVQTPPAATTSNKPNLPSAIQKLESDMVRVIGGTFTMGCKSGRDSDCDSDESPAHDVRVRDFSIGRHEVTQAQWRAVMGSDPPELYNKGCDECPVERVSWNDIQDFLKKLNAQTGKQYRLPTEAEWEYAARGGSQSRGFLYSGSNAIDEVAWYTSNSGNKTRPVGGKKPNELGLYDMSGNVWEWCEDDWHGNYNGAPTDGSAWIDSPRASYRVSRGGSWFNTAQFCRASYRDYNTPSLRLDNLGFRLAL